MFLEYGDDSVAQLGGVHLACEQASNLLTKILEWGRLMAYLEQSTRYIPYDVASRRALPVRAALRRSCESRFGARYVGDLDALFDTYCVVPPGDCPTGHASASRRSRPTPTSSTSRRSRPRRATPCAGCCPAATLSNVGIYGTGQAFEALLLRMRAHPLPEARDYAAMMLDELRKVIPSFLTRVDRPDRGGAWSAYLERTRDETAGARAARSSPVTSRSRAPQ